MVSRLSLLAGQPVEPFDVTSSTLFYGDYGAPQFSLNLAGRAALTLHDVFSDGTQLLTSPMPAMEVPVTGTPIGGMTANGGLAALTDGNLNKGYLACARSSSAIAGFDPVNSAGLAFSSPQAVTRLIVTSPNNGGFRGDNQFTPWKLVASNINDVTTGIQLAAGYGPPSTGASVSGIDILFPNGLGFSYCWFVPWGNGSNNTFVAQLQLFATLPIAARGIVAAADKYVNANIISAVGNIGTVPLAAQAAEYLGTILISETAGQMRFTRSYGPKGMVPVWNAKNRQRIAIVAGDNGPPVGGHFVYPVASQLSYAFAPTPGHGSPIGLTYVDGMAEAAADLRYTQGIFLDALAASAACWTGIGINSTRTPQGRWDSRTIDNTPGPQEGVSLVSECTVQPRYGATTAYPLIGSRGNVSGNWGEGNMGLSAELEY